MSTEGSTIARLTAENADLKEKVNRYRQQTGALMVDADRREARARKIAESCEEHGKEIQYLRHAASWYWEQMNHEQSARWAVITQLMRGVQNLERQTEPIPVATVIDVLNKAIKAHDRAVHKPVKFPTEADCIRTGGCDHGGLTEGLKVEIAEALGL